MGAGAIPLSIEKVLKDRLKNKSDIKIYLADTSYEGEGKITHEMLTPHTVTVELGGKAASRSVTVDKNMSVEVFP